MLNEPEDKHKIAKWMAHSTSENETTQKATKEKWAETKVWDYKREKKLFENAC